MGINISSLTSAQLEASDIKLAFFDVDGTIVGAPGAVSPATKSALIAARSHGCQLAIASGRPYFGAKTLLKELDMTAPSLFYSGALIVDPVTGSQLDSHPLSPAQVDDLLQWGNQHGFHIELYTADNYFISAPSKFAAIHAHYLGFEPTVRSFATLKDQGILKVVFISDEASKVAALHSFAAQTPNYSVGIGYGPAHPTITFGNVTSRAASRDKAFYKILELTGITSAQVAAFGDGEADLPFLTRAGFGVAMGNAPEMVRSAAPFVTESVSNDGVAKALRVLFRLKEDGSAAQ